MGLKCTKVGRRGDLMVSVLVSGLSGPGLSPGRGHCVVFLGKTLDSHIASLHPGVEMGTGEFNAGGNPVTDSSRVVEILLVASQRPELSAGVMGHYA